MKEVINNVLKQRKILIVSTIITLIALILCLFHALFLYQKYKKEQLTSLEMDVVENYISPTEWVPGELVNKDVSIVNMGVNPTLVRVRMDEVLYLLESTKTQEDTSVLKIYEAGKNDNFTFKELIQQEQMPVYINASTLAEIVDSDIDNWKNVSKDIDTANGNTALIDAGIIVLQNTTNDIYGNHNYQFLAFKQVNPNDYKYDEDPIIFDNANTVADNSRYKNFGIIVGNETVCYQNVRVNMQNVKSEDLTEKYKEMDFMVQSYKKLEKVAGVHELTDDGIVGSNHEYLKILFGADVVVFDPKTMTDFSSIYGKWVYDKQSQHFYWCGVVGSGETTAQLLDGVKLDETADDKYKHMRYNLDIKYDVIHSSKSEIESSWGVDSEHSKAMSEELMNLMQQIPIIGD